jgi:hypothetical protein
MIMPTVVIKLCVVANGKMLWYLLASMRRRIITCHEFIFWIQIPSTYCGKFENSQHQLRCPCYFSSLKKSNFCCIINYEHILASLLL